MKKRTTFTEEQAQIVGAILIALPDNKDEVTNLKIKELFNNEDIFDYDGNKWEFSAVSFLESYKNLEEAKSFLNEIERITAVRNIEDKCTGFYSGCGCVICEIRDKRGDKRRRVR